MAEFPYHQFIKQYRRFVDKVWLATGCCAFVCLLLLGPAHGITLGKSATLSSSPAHLVEIAAKSEPTLMAIDSHANKAYYAAGEAANDDCQMDADIDMIPVLAFYAVLTMRGFVRERSPWPPQFDGPLGGAKPPLRPPMPVGFGI